MDSSGKKADEDGEKEEGELEEGELDDDEEPKTEEVAEQLEEKEDTVKEGNSEQQDSGVVPGNEGKKGEVDKEERERERKSKKRKHREEGEDRRKSTKKKKHGSETDQKQFRRKQLSDFDRMLLEERYRHGVSPPTAELYKEMDPYGLSPDPPLFEATPALLPHPEGSGEESGDGGIPDMEKQKSRGGNRHFPPLGIDGRGPPMFRKEEMLCPNINCTKADCMYLHEGPSQRKMELCKFYLKNCCAKKEKCLYMHKEFPCKLYHMGVKCRFGADCQFSHSSITPATRNVLLKHLEMAPKDILGTFPRLSKSLANIVIEVTENYRKGVTEVDRLKLERLVNIYGKGFKYVDKILKHHARAKEDLKRKLERIVERERNEAERHCYETRRPKGTRGRSEDMENEFSPDKAEFHRARRRPLKPMHQSDGMAPYIRRRENYEFNRSNHHYEDEMRMEHGDDHDDGGQRTPIDEGSDKWYTSDDDQAAHCDDGIYHERNLALEEQRITSESYSELENSNEKNQSSSKSLFSNINLANIKISPDLANVLSALKHITHPKKSGIDSHSICETLLSKEGADSEEQLAGTEGNEQIIRDQRVEKDSVSKLSDSPRDPRQSKEQGAVIADFIKNVRNSQTENLLDMLSPKNNVNVVVGLGSDNKNISCDTDMRVIPNVNRREEKQVLDIKLSKQDTDMRLHEPSIYDLGLKKLNVFSSEDKIENTLPFKVPLHTPAKEIDASYSSHPPMCYKLIKITVPKTDFSYLKVDKNDDPQKYEDPRIQRMLKRSSSEDGVISPTSHYVVESPTSPPPENVSKSEQYGEAESRDPRMPSGTSRAEPRVDPRVSTQTDPRVPSRSDPRCLDNRDPRSSGPCFSGPIFPGGGEGVVFPMASLGMLGHINLDPRKKPGLLGPAPKELLGMGPMMNPALAQSFMMNAGAGGAFFEDMMGPRFPPHLQGWPGAASSHDPRLQRNAEGSYSPPVL